MTNIFQHLTSQRAKKKKTLGENHFQDVKCFVVKFFVLLIVIGDQSVPCLTYWDGCNDIVSLCIMGSNKCMSTMLMVYSSA